MDAAQDWRAVQRADERGQVLGQGGSLIIPRNLPGRPILIAHLVSLTGSQARALPHAPSDSAPLIFKAQGTQCSLSVTGTASAQGRRVERVVERSAGTVCALSAFWAQVGGIGAGRALRAPQRSPLNPRVRGSSPWRRTRPDLARFTVSLLSLLSVLSSWLLHVAR